MKVFISADMEGLPGATHWDDVDASKPEYREFQDIMTRMVAASCSAAHSAGASEIVIKDAHWTGRNIIASQLPRGVRLIRGWSGHPFKMVEGLDESFHAVVMLGYHSAAGTDSNPLAHTMNSSRFGRVLLNEKVLSEFLLHTYAAATVGVPTVCVSGDEALCADVKALNESIVTIPVCRGFGSASISSHPRECEDWIANGVRSALMRDRTAYRVALPAEFLLRIEYKLHSEAYRASFYPGAHRENACVVTFRAKDFFDVLRFMNFA